MKNLKYILALAIFIFMAKSVFAADLTKTPTHLSAADNTVLRSSLAAAATSATLEPVTKWVNGSKTKGCFDTPSGFVLIEDGTGRQEWASYGSKSCNTTTNVTTLNEMRRGLSPVTPSFTAGTGFTWDSGTRIKVVDYPIIYNTAVRTDTGAYMTGSGVILSDQTSQSWLVAPNVTSAQLSAFTVNRAGHIVWDSTAGVLKYSDGSNNYSIAATTGSLVNIGYSTRGVGELGTPTEIYNRTASGSTNAGLVLAVKDVITGSGSAASTGATSNVVATSGAYLHGTLLGPSIGSGKIAVATANNTLTFKTPANVLTQNFSLLCVGLANTTATGASSTAEQPTGASCSIPANSLAAGDILKIDFSDKRTIASGDMDVWVKMNSTAAGGSSVKLGIFRNNNSVTTSNGSSTVLATVRTIGSSGTMLAHGEMSTNDAVDENTLTDQDDSNTEPDVETVNTTLANTLEISVKFSASDATHSYSVHNFIVSKFKAP